MIEQDIRVSALSAIVVLDAMEEAGLVLTRTVTEVCGCGGYGWVLRGRDVPGDGVLVKTPGELIEEVVALGLDPDVIFRDVPEYFPEGVGITPLA